MKAAVNRLLSSARTSHLGLSLGKVKYSRFHVCEVHAELSKSSVGARRRAFGRVKLSL